MRWMVVGLVLAVAMAACSTSDEERREQQEKCDSIAAEIRRASVARGIPPQGACNNPSVPDFGQACDSLRKCNAELDEMD